VSNRAAHVTGCNANADGSCLLASFFPFPFPLDPTPFLRVKVTWAHVMLHAWGKYIYIYISSFSGQSGLAENACMHDKKCLLWKGVCLGFVVYHRTQKKIDELRPRSLAMHT
jgi:hypothetical protein